MSAGEKLLWVVLGAGCLAAILPDAPPPAATTLPSAAAAEKPAADASQPTLAPIGNGFASQELQRAPDGHFYAEAQVNGARVRFMVDTGASMVALTRDDAQRAGIALSSERAVAMAAGGPVETVPATIDRLAVGALVARDVEAAVVEDLSVSLLGQSFLAQVGRVEIQGDRMVLR